ncbi:hypothetical protein [Thalassovita sp.]|uniref:hypothetical protein n=1 Tax=Thalassovita sp. TaxID=1979401 RepID=UPI002B2775AD|nr:hypothetical protein [Thalassovita sp.]
MVAATLQSVDMSLERARMVVSRAAFVSDEDLRVASQYLVDYGDWMDCTRGASVLRQLDIERETAKIFAPVEAPLAEEEEEDNSVRDLWALFGLLAFSLCAYFFVDAVMAMFGHLLNLLRIADGGM